MKKIGMCQACGDPGKTIIHNGGEYCMHCAGLMGLDKDDDQEEADEEEGVDWRDVCWSGE